MYTVTKCTVLPIRTELQNSERINRVAFTRLDRNTHLLSSYSFLILKQNLQDLFLKHFFVTEDYYSFFQVRELQFLY